MTDSDNSANSISVEQLRELQARHLRMSMQLMAVQTQHMQQQQLHMQTMESVARRTLAATESIKADIGKYVEAVLNPEQ